MNNSVYENLRNRVQVELVTDAYTLRKRVTKPSFYRGNPITDCFTVVHCRVATLTLKRPIYVGFVVIELSKLHMYDFHYNHMKAKYPRADQLRLLFTDTDRRAYAVQAENIYEDMASYAATRFDLSEYPLHHHLFSDSNRKALGFFKDELNSIPMEEFVWLRPKCYAFLCTGKVDRNVLQHVGSVEKKSAKGVRRNVKDEHLHFSHYLDILRTFKSYVCKQNLLSSTNHTVRTVHSPKVGLTAFDTKRWLCEDIVHTHSHGHRDTVADPMYLVNQSFIIQCIIDALRRTRVDRSVWGSPRPESAWGSPESANESTWGSFESADESTWGSPRAELGARAGYDSS